MATRVEYEVLCRKIDSGGGDKGTSIPGSCQAL